MYKEEEVHQIVHYYDWSEVLEMDIWHGGFAQIT